MSFRDIVSADWVESSVCKRDEKYKIESGYDSWLEGEEYQSKKAHGIRKGVEDVHEED